MDYKMEKLFIGGAGILANTVANTVVAEAIPTPDEISAIAQILTSIAIGIVTIIGLLKKKK